MVRDKDRDRVRVRVRIRYRIVRALVRRQSPAQLGSSTSVPSLHFSGTRRSRCFP